MNPYTVVLQKPGSAQFGVYRVSAEDQPSAYSRVREHLKLAPRTDAPLCISAWDLVAVFSGWPPLAATGPLTDNIVINS